MPSYPPVLIFIPGPQDAVGHVLTSVGNGFAHWAPSSGGGGAEMFTTFVDVGAVPSREWRGTFPHPGALVGALVGGEVSSIMPPSKDADEWEMADISARFLVLAPGLVDVILTGRDGFIEGEFFLNYTIGV